MNNFKHIILNGQGVRAFKETKPEYYSYDSMSSNWAKPTFEEHEKAAKERYNTWLASGIDIEFYPGEEIKIKLAIFNVPASKQIGYDITDFCEIKPLDCETDECFSTDCVRIHACASPKLYAFFKAPIEEEKSVRATARETFEKYMPEHKDDAFAWHIYKRAFDIANDNLKLIK